MSEYVMVLDQGRTCSRCIIFDLKGSIMSVTQNEFTQNELGLIENNPIEIWSSQLEAAKRAMKKLSIEGSQIASIRVTVTNPIEPEPTPAPAPATLAAVIWDKDTGIPIYNDIIYQHDKASTFCDELKKKGFEPKIKERTGLTLDVYFSGVKLKWILDHVEGVRQRAFSGKLLFGTIDSWIIWNLTKGKIHVIDYSSASKTMLFNIHNLYWDKEILREFDIPEIMLPDVKPPGSFYGYTDPILFEIEIPIMGTETIDDEQGNSF